MKDNKEQPKFKVVCASYGTKDCKNLDIENSGNIFNELNDEIMEIKAWDSSERPLVLSQDKVEEIHKKFMSRHTEYAENIRNNMREASKSRDEQRGE